MINIALRSLGNQLVAKSSPGAKSRDVVEQQISKPDIPNEGGVGTVQRSQVEQPLERAVPAGSEKIVSVQPTVEGTTVAPTGDLSQNAPGVVPPVSAPVPASSAVGLPGNVKATVPSGANNQPLLQGMPTGQTPQGKAGSVQSSVGGTAQVAGASPKAPVTAPTKVVGAAAPKMQSQIESFLRSFFGNKASADTEKTLNSAAYNAYNALSGVQKAAIRSGEVPRTIGQEVTGKIGKALTNFGISIKAPQIIPGGLGATMQSMGGQSKQGDTRQTGNVGGTLRSIANNVYSNLRSLFGGKK